MAKNLMERTDYSLIAEGVRADEQTLSVFKPFWVCFVGNIGVGTWLMGVILAGMGLNFAEALFVLLVGSIVGSILPAVMALLGPVTRLSQMEMGRMSLGNTGKKLPAFLNWLGAIGYDTITNILSAAALAALCTAFGLPLPFWLALGILVAIQLVAGMYGHHLIQDTSRYTGILLGLFFIVIGLIAVHKTGGAPTLDHVATPKDIGMSLVLIASNNIGSGPYASDYTRYLPAATPKRAIFTTIFAGLFLSLFVLAAFGYLTASAVSDQTPDGVMKALQGLTGRFAPLVLFLVAFNSIPVNAINDNSGAYSLMAAGFKFSRPAAAILSAMVGYIVCLAASNSFVDFFENFLMLFAHWIAPWAAILLVHWYMVGGKDLTAPPGITVGCMIFTIITLVSIALFSANSLYTGFLSNAVGGADIGPYVGFVAAGAFYYAALRLWPAKYKAIRA